MPLLVHQIAGTAATEALLQEHDLSDPRWAAVVKSALDADDAEEAAAAAAGRPWPPRGAPLRARSCMRLA